MNYGQDALFMNFLNTSFIKKKCLWITGEKPIFRIHFYEYSVDNFLKYENLMRFWRAIFK